VNRSHLQIASQPLHPLFTSPLSGCFTTDIMTPRARDEALFSASFLPLSPSPHNIRGGGLSAGSPSAVPRRNDLRITFYHLVSLVGVVKYGNGGGFKLNSGPGGGSGLACFCDTTDSREGCVWGGTRKGRSFFCLDSQHWLGPPKKKVKELSRKIFPLSRRNGVCVCSSTMMWFVGVSRNQLMLTGLQPDRASGPTNPLAGMQCTSSEGKCGDLCMHGCQLTRM